METQTATRPIEIDPGTLKGAASLFARIGDLYTRRLPDDHSKAVSVCSDLQRLMHELFEFSEFAGLDIYEFDHLRNLVEKDDLAKAMNIADKLQNLMHLQMIIDIAGPLTDAADDYFTEICRQLDQD